MLPKRVDVEVTPPPVRSSSSSSLAPHRNSLIFIGSLPFALTDCQCLLREQPERTPPSFLPKSRKTTSLIIHPVLIRLPQWTISPIVSAKTPLLPLVTSTGKTGELSRVSKATSPTTRS